MSTDGDVSHPHQRIGDDLRAEAQRAHQLLEHALSRGDVDAIRAAMQDAGRVLDRVHGSRS